MRYGSLCSGIEAATAAWDRLGWKPVFFAEIEQFCCESLAFRFPSIPNLGDICAQDFIEKAIASGSIDVLVGGPPCQAFSVAGLRGGLADSRGNLTLRYLAVVDALRPRWVVYENVPGILSATSHVAPDPRAPGNDMDAYEGCEDGAEIVVEDQYDSHEDHAFSCFLAGLSELGYGFSYGVLDAQYFGVAQRRERVFVIGYPGAWQPAAAVLLDRESMSGNYPPSREARQSVTGTISARTSGGGGLGTDFEIGGGLVNGSSDVRNGTMQWNGQAEEPFCQRDSEVRAGMPQMPPDGERGQEGRSSQSCMSGMRLEQGPLRSSPNRAEKGVQAWQRSDFMSELPSDGNARTHGDIVIPILEAGARTGKSTDDIRAGSGIGDDGDPMFTLQSGKQHAIGIANTLNANSGRRQLEETLIPFDSAQVTSKDNRSNPQPGDPSFPLHGGDPPMIVGAVSSKWAKGTGDKAHVMERSAVRRLTPLECERLQGFPDGWTLIPRNGGKPAADGPRYRALGNSMAVPVITWIGQQIQAVDDALKAEVLS